jgi:thiol-disulfide isomerase/thioredoxin
MAQKKGIIFEKEGTTFDQAVEKASKENKLIFMDCYTTWCGPCRMMSRDVFPQEIVGNYLNPKYVSLKIDMEKGEGIELRKKLQVNAFPTLIVFNRKGEELGRFLGASKGEEFIERVKAASIDNSSLEMDKRFAAGERNEAFLLEYLTTLSGAYKREQCSIVAEALLQEKEKTFAADKKLSDVFMKYINNPFYPAFTYTIAHPEELIAVYGEEPVKMKLQSVWHSYPKGLINDVDANTAFDTEKFNRFLSLMEENKVKERDGIRLETLIAWAEKQEDWTKYADYLTEFSNHPELDLTDLMLCKWTTPLATKCTEKPPKEEVIKLLQKRIDDLDSGRRQPQTQQGNMKLSGDLKRAMVMLIGKLEES